MRDAEGFDSLLESTLSEIANVHAPMGLSERLVRRGPRTSRVWWRPMQLPVMGVTALAACSFLMIWSGSEKQNHVTALPVIPSQSGGFHERMGASVEEPLQDLRPARPQGRVRKIRRTEMRDPSDREEMLRPQALEVSPLRIDPLRVASLLSETD